MLAQAARHPLRSWLDFAFSPLLCPTDASDSCFAGRATSAAHSPRKAKVGLDIGKSTTEFKSERYTSHGWVALEKRVSVFPMERWFEQEDIACTSIVDSVKVQGSSAYCA